MQTPLIKMPWLVSRDRGVLRPVSNAYASRLSSIIIGTGQNFIQARMCSLCSHRADSRLPILGSQSSFEEDGGSRSSSWLLYVLVGDLFCRHSYKCWEDRGAQRLACKKDILAA